MARIPGFAREARAAAGRSQAGPASCAAWTSLTGPPSLPTWPSTAWTWTPEQAAGRYAALTGRDLSDMRFHRVLGILKLGVIFLQPHALHQRGATADPRYIAFGPLAGGLLEFAMEVKAGRVF